MLHNLAKCFHLSVEVDLNTTLTDGKVTANKTVEATPKDVAITDCVELTKDEYYSVEAAGQPHEKEEICYN